MGMGQVGIRDTKENVTLGRCALDICFLGAGLRLLAVGNESFGEGVDATLEIPGDEADEEE